MYNYDISFRHLMAHYPDRNWGVIYQQGWTLLLKDKTSHGNNNNNYPNFSGKKKVKAGSRCDNFCWKFNKGIPYGSMSLWI